MLNFIFKTIIEIQIFEKQFLNFQALKKFCSRRPISNFTQIFDYIYMILIDYNVIKYKNLSSYFNGVKWEIHFDQENLNVFTIKKFPKI